MELNKLNKRDLQERAITIIKPLIPVDAEERVTRAFKQWNQILREHIRNETGLKLSEGDGRYTIPVRIVEGFSAGLAQLINRHQDPILWRLIIGQPKLGGIIAGLNFLLEDWDGLEQWRLLPPEARNGGACLAQTVEIVAALQHVAMAKEVQEHIKKIHEDILGTYCFLPGQTYGVDLYWIPIAMIAAMLDVTIEDLTLVVLAHELTHGYTHIGRDIDGIQWNDRAFGTSDPMIVEGLAQFYTHVLTERMAARNPGPHMAYTKLLTIQSGPYHAHLDWLADEVRQRGEIVRFTMIAARSWKITENTAWLQLLEITQKSLQR